MEEVKTSEFTRLPELFNDKKNLLPYSFGVKKGEDRRFLTYERSAMYR